MSFEIPKDSFTAFRLKYGDSVQISDASTTVLLGSLPKFWFNKHKGNLLNSIKKSTRAIINTSFNLVAEQLDNDYDMRDPFDNKYWKFKDTEQDYEFGGGDTSYGDGDTESHDDKEEPEDEEQFHDSGKASSKEGKEEAHINLLKPEPLQESEFPQDLIITHQDSLIKSVTANYITKPISKLKSNNKKLIINYYKKGEIIKIEKMLVLIKMIVNLSNENSIFEKFTENEPCDTRVFDRWKEYFVVARSTGNPDEPVIIQFYTKREIYKDQLEDEDNNKNKSKHEYYLNFTVNKTCLINFYNNFDKTISIMKGRFVYILRPHTTLSSIKWLSILNNFFNHNDDFDNNVDKINVKIPKFDIEIDLKLSFDLYKDLLLKDRSFKTIKITELDNGYSISKSLILNSIVKRIKLKIINSGFANMISYWNSNNRIIGLCWKHYDRLEWLFGDTLINLFWQSSMITNYQLQLRLIEHYPTSVELNDGTTFKEPFPIEGYLARLTTQSGDLNKNFLNLQKFLKFNYFFTNNNLLCFTSAFKSLPPLPIYFSDGENNSNFNLSEIYIHNPFELDQNQHFRWLNLKLPNDEFRKFDNFAKNEFERKISLILRSNYIIDLVNVKSINKIDHKNFPLTIKLSSNLFWFENFSPDSEEGKEEEKEALNDSFFQIELNNNCKLILKASNREMRDEWIERLIELTKYWKLRIERDNQLILKIKKSNLEILQNEKNSNNNTNDNTNEYNNEYKTDFFKWENLKSLASSQIYNITAQSMFRSIIKSGEIFQKPKKHSIFKKFYIVLIPGFILLFKCFKRSKLTGVSKDINSYTHYLTIPINDCYIYSGKLTELDLLERDNEFDQLNPGKHSLPRVYSDGLLSSDEEYARSFTLWFGTKRAISGFQSNKHDDDNNTTTKNPNVLRLVNRLGVTGRSMVFMCRSKQEKDLWLTNLYTEIERFSNSNLNNEVKIKGV